MTDQIAGQYGAQNEAKIRAALETATALPAAPAPGPAPELVLTAPDDAAAKRAVRREHVEQARLFDEIDRAVAGARDGADMIFAIPNGTAAGRKVGHAMKREGVRRGVPDIFVAVPRIRQDPSPHFYSGLWVEMKLPGGVPSDLSGDQAGWHGRLRARGYDVEVAWGWRHAWRVICDYLGWEGDK